MSEPTSWIQELRTLLAAAPQLEPIVEGSERLALLVPLFVEAGGLWVLMEQRSTGGEALFSGAVVEAGEDAWDAALRAGAEDAGLPAEAVLRLGELAPIELVGAGDDEDDDGEGGLAVPCVGAVPVAAARTAVDAGDNDVFQVPLQAFGNPTLVEEFLVEPESGEGPVRRMRAIHVGGRRIWGLGVFVMEDLLERLQGDVT